MKTLEYQAHIVSMYGYIVSKFTPQIVMEYCEMGDILKYVSNKELIDENRDTIVKELTSFAWQISDGMCYISSKGIVHRDLAARNVLLTKNKVAKICDFGLAIFENEKMNEFQRTLLPVRWTAPETYGAKTFTTKGDVWSFGVALWEIYSLGEIPYKEIAPAELQRHILEGNRLQMPELCDKEIFPLMHQCWCIDSEDRPSFDYLKTEISNRILDTTGTYGYLDTRAQTLVGNGNDSDHETS